MAEPQRNILIVDDDDLIHQAIKMILPKNWKATSIRGVGQVPTNSFFHAAFVDMHLTKNTSAAEGLASIRAIREQFPLVEIFGMSGDLTMDLMEKALAAGARRFLAKPLMPEEVQSIIDKVEALWLIRQSDERCGRIAHMWIGSSKASQQVMLGISGLRGERGPILIEGETGTGKEVVASLLNTQENGRPLISLNLGAIPDNLFESELFGHVRGAFTGADALKIGLTEAANGGDLFLDEIEALPLSQQAKLLRFLESGEIRRVGAKEPIYLKVRVIAASNKSLIELVKKGKFREDLMFRLSGKKIVLPPLRERTEDLAELCKYFLSKESSARRKIFAEQALEVLKSYPFPGNVRELKRICEQLSLTSPLPVIRPQDVRSLLPTEDIQTAVSFQLERGLPDLIGNFEKQLLSNALDRTNSDVDQAAGLLKISRSSFYKKMKDYGIGGISGGATQ
ncbi:MAG: sigma-54-dependent Fis family transcriptional regulator [Bdellovibrio sp.]|nr:MAG: sigma-54-dependent Fis family transcriptional regulator [Bdellovibrio sp.]